MPSPHPTLHHHPQLKKKRNLINLWYTTINRLNFYFHSNLSFIYVLSQSVLVFFLFFFADIETVLLSYRLFIEITVTLHRRELHSGLNTFWDTVGINLCDLKLLSWGFVKNIYWTFGHFVAYLCLLYFSLLNGHCCCCSHSFTNRKKSNSHSSCYFHSGSRNEIRTMRSITIRLNKLIKWPNVCIDRELTVKLLDPRYGM